MPNISQPQRSTAQDFKPLETDDYPMVIREASEGPSAFANERGDYPEQVSITWELEGTPEQRASWEADGYRPDQRVYQRFSNFFGFNRDGVPSKYYTFAETLHKQGLITESFEVKDLVGIKQLVFVEKYTKEFGANKGQPGNRVLAIRPLNATGPAIELPRDRTSATQATTRSKVNLADADDIDTPQIPDDLPELQGMTTAGLRIVAQNLANECGGNWTKRDWDTMSPSLLISGIQKMKATLAEPEDDPNKDLF